MQKTLLLLATALFIHLGMPKTQAASSISVDFFYDQLSDYGDWVEVGEYGYGWQPRDVDAEWRPYSDGRWAYTEAGWTWLSDEPYGWAVYHYGRWARLEGRGWVWIPGTEWAPAWVSWRRSPRHVGWAPLPPEASFRRSVGFSGWVDSYYDIGPSAYRFVEVRNFGAPRLRTVFIEPRENITIIRQTTNITRITYVNGVVNDGGPRYEDISRESAEPVRRLKLERRHEVEGDRSRFRGEQLRSRVEGDSLRVFAPGFNARAEAPPKKLAAKIEKVEINRGWKDAGPAADVEKLRVKVRGETKAPEGLPPQPKFEKLAEQTATAEPQTTKEKAPTVAPAEEPRGAKKKDGPPGQEPPAPVVSAPAEREIAPLDNPLAPEAPLKPQKSKTRVEKVDDSEVPAQPPAAPARKEMKPGKPTLPAVEPVEPGMKEPRTERKLPPAPEPSAPKTERAFPPEPAPRREASEPPKEEPRKPKMERPDAVREVLPPVESAQPKRERAAPPNPAHPNPPQPAPRGDDEKAKVGKGKATEEKKPDDEATKAR